MTPTETRPPSPLAEIEFLPDHPATDGGPHGRARRRTPRPITPQARLDRLRLALDEAERGGATVMRIDAVRATVAESGGAG